MIPGGASAVAAAYDFHDAKVLYTSLLSRKSQGEIVASPITLIPALKYGAFPLLIVTPPTTVRSGACQGVPDKGNGRRNPGRENVVKRWSRFR
jgi:hypothetical protein